jgi:glutathione S-transferase
MIEVHHLNASRSTRLPPGCSKNSVSTTSSSCTSATQRRICAAELKAISPRQSTSHPRQRRRIFESGAIVESDSALARPICAAVGADYNRYIRFLHYAEGSAMLPMLRLYVGRWGSAPLMPRIQSETENHLAFEQRAANRDFRRQ